MSSVHADVSRACALPLIPRLCSLGDSGHLSISSCSRGACLQGVQSLGAIDFNKMIGGKRARVRGLACP